MKVDKDIIIQKLLDENSPEVENKLLEMKDDPDFEAYNFLYDNLKQKVAQDLSYSFKSSVIRRIEIEKKQADDTKFYWFFGITFIIGLGVIAAMLYGLKDYFIPILTIIAKFKGFILIIIVAILLSKTLDQRLNKKHM
jgi:hypothetical protein